MGDAAPGAIIAGKYQLEERIGRGATGTVWRARQLALDRPVAIKLLHGPAAEEGEARARFVREARVASTLAHPGSVAVLDFGEDEHGPYLVMELLEGETLRARLERGPLPRLLALAVARQIAAALAAAHRIHLVHRDIKPENVFLAPRAAAAGGDDHDDAVDRVKVVDFGLAFIAAPLEGSARALGRMTDEGILGGTPGYMAPEQVRGAAIGPAADIYALGCVVYELIAGRPPFVGAVGEILSRHAYAPPVPLRALDLAPPPPPALDELVTAMLGKAPPLRPTANRVIATLAAIEAELAGAAPRAPAGRTAVGAVDRADRALPRPSPPAPAPEAAGDGLAVAVVGALADDHALALAAAGLAVAPVALAEVARGALVWAPGADGAALAALRARGAVVVTDADGEAAGLVAHVRAGVAEAVVRPVAGDELARRLRRAWLHRREPAA